MSWPDRYRLRDENLGMVLVVTKDVQLGIRLFVRHIVSQIWHMETQDSLKIQTPNFMYTILVNVYAPRCVIFFCDTFYIYHF